MTKKNYFYDRFFESNRNFTTEHVKIVKTPGFSRIPGKVATLMILLENQILITNFLVFDETM